MVPAVFFSKTNTSSTPSPPEDRPKSILPWEGIDTPVVVAPFVFYSVKQKKAKARFLRHFQQLTSELNLNIDLQEDWRNRYILGLDKRKNVLVYCQIGENEDKKEVALQEVSRAVVYQYYLNEHDPAANNKTLNQLTLQLYFKTPPNKVLNLEIYNSEFHSDQLGETVIASKWAEVINQCVTK